MKQYRGMFAPKFRPSVPERVSVVHRTRQHISDETIEIVDMSDAQVDEYMRVYRAGFLRKRADRRRRLERQWNADAKRMRTAMTCGFGG